MKKLIALLLLVVIMYSLLAVIALADNTDIISPQLTPSPGSPAPTGEPVAPSPQTGETGTVIIAALIGVSALCAAAFLFRKVVA